MRGRVVGVVSKCGLGLQYCRFPLPFGEENDRLCMWANVSSG